MNVYAAADLLTVVAVPMINGMRKIFRLILRMISAIDAFSQSRFTNEEKKRMPTIQICILIGYIRVTTIHSYI